MTNTNEQGVSLQMDHRSISVLVIDDDDFILEVIKEMLMHFGIEQVHLASNGRAALRSLRSLDREPDFVILDVYMPDMDGIEFVDELARIHYRGGVILASGSDIQMLQMATQLAIANGLNVRAALIKPINFEDLANALALQ